jgi:hypothetical protein
MPPWGGVHAVYWAGHLYSPSLPPSRPIPQPSNSSISFGIATLRHWKSVEVPRTRGEEESATGGEGPVLAKLPQHRIDAQRLRRQLVQAPLRPPPHGKGEAARQPAGAEVQLAVLAAALQLVKPGV